MNDWRKPCQHGRYDGHQNWLSYRKVPDSPGDYEGEPRCPGGSPVTAADLEGEKVWWCEEHKCPSNVPAICPVGWFADEAEDCRLVEARLLIPIPDPVAAE